jgi:hypothetical protein
MRRLLLGIAFIVLASSAPAQAGPVLEDVVSTKAHEDHPTASAEFEAWSAYQRQNDAWSVYARPTGGTRFKVNGGRRDAVTGAIDGATLVYQSFTRRSSSIRFFDLLTKTTTSAPDAVNTDAWEYWPSLSGDLLLFGRVTGDVDRDLILYDLSTGTETVLDHTNGTRRNIQPGQVNGNYAVWVTFTPSSCQAYVYDIAAGTTTAVPRPDDRCQYGASVGSDGTAYVGQSAFGCGRHVQLLAYPVGGSVSQVVSLERGTDFFFTFALTNADGSTSVYLDPGPCGAKPDIAKLTIV